MSDPPFPPPILAFDALEINSRQLPCLLNLEEEGRLLWLLVVVVLPAPPAAPLLARLLQSLPMLSLRVMPLLLMLLPPLPLPLPPDLTMAICTSSVGTVAWEAGRRAAFGERCVCGGGR